MDQVIIAAIAASRQDHTKVILAAFWRDLTQLLALGWPPDAPARSRQ